MNSSSDSKSPESPVEGREGTSEWEPLPFTDVLFGHLLADLLGALIMLGLLWGGRFLDLLPSGGSILIGVAGAHVVNVLVAASVFRQFAIRQRHDSPGSVAMSALLYGVSLASGAVGGLIIGGLDVKWIGAGAIASLVGYGATLTMSQPWRRGMSRDQVRSAWAETKEMTSKLSSEKDS